MKNICKINKVSSLTIVSLLLLGVQSTSLAANYAYITNAIESFIQESYAGQNINVTINPLDKRLQLQDCHEHLSISWRNNAQRLGRTSVNVRCNKEQDWSLYLPVNIKLYKHIVTAKSMIQGRQVIQKSDITLSLRDISGYHRGYLTEPEQIIGYVSKRPISQGQAIIPIMLKQPLLVKRGQRVTIIAQQSGIQIRTVGTALGNASKGDSVKIRNNRSKKIIEGIAVDSNTVKIQL